MMQNYAEERDLTERLLMDHYAQTDRQLTAHKAMNWIANVAEQDQRILQQVTQYLNERLPGPKPHYVMAAPGLDTGADAPIEAMMPGPVFRQALPPGPVKEELPPGPVKELAPPVEFPQSHADMMRLYYPDAEMTSEYFSYDIPGPDQVYHPPELISGFIASDTDVSEQVYKYDEGMMNGFAASDALAQAYRQLDQVYRQTYDATLAELSAEMGAYEWATYEDPATDDDIFQYECTQVMPLDDDRASTAAQDEDDFRMRLLMDLMEPDGLSQSHCQAEETEEGTLEEVTDSMCEEVTEVANKVVLGGAQAVTTVVLKMLPKMCSREMLIKTLVDKDYHMDFVYLPLDFDSRLSRGYAIINFSTEAEATRFHQEYDKVAIDKPVFGTRKSTVLKVEVATRQGFDECIKKHVKMILHVRNIKMLPAVFEGRTPVLLTPDYLRLHYSHLIV